MMYIKAKWYSLALVAVLHFFCLKGVTGSSSARVWDILSNTDVVLYSVESKVCDIDAQFASDFTSIFTVLDGIETKYCDVEILVENTQSFVDSVIDALATLETRVDSISSSLDIVSSSLDTLILEDFEGTCTVINTMSSTITSRFSSIQSDLNTIEMTVDVISGDQLDAFLGTCTMIASISDVVMHNMDALCDIAATSASNVDTIESYIDILMNTVYTLESKIDDLTPVIEAGFAGTFTALSEQEHKLEIVSQKSISLNDTLAALTELDLIDDKLTAINSDLDNLDDNVASLCDNLETIQSLVDPLSSLLDIVESNIDELAQDQNTVLSSVQTIHAQTTTIDSKIDSILEINATTESKLSNIESDIENILLSAVITLESTVDISNALTISIESYVDRLESIADAVFIDICTIESKVERIEGSLIEIETTLDVVFTFESSIDVLNSNIDIAIDKSFTTESKLDFLDISALSQLDTAITIDSFVDILDQQTTTINSVLNTITSVALTIESKVDIIDIELGTIKSKVCDIESRIDVHNGIATTIQSNISTVTSNLDALGIDFQETWTIVDALNAKNITIQSFIGTSISQVDLLDGSEIDGDLGGTFTALDALGNEFLTIESVLDGIPLSVPDIAGSFSVIEEMLQKSCTMESRLGIAENLLLEFALGSCIGRPISADDIGTAGYTITESGRYFLTESIAFAPSTGVPAITISADDVELDMCYNVIDQTNGTTGVNGVLVDGVSNVVIKNGTMYTIIGNQIEVADGSSNITIQDMNIISTLGSSSSGILFSGNIHNVVVKDSQITNSQGRGIQIESGSHFVLDNLILRRNTLDGIYIFPGFNTICDVYINECLFLANASSTCSGAIAILGTNGERRNIIINNCDMEYNRFVNATIYAESLIDSVIKNNSILYSGEGINAPSKANTHGIYLTSEPSGVEIYNNLIRLSTGNGIFIDNAGPVPCFIHGNIISYQSAGTNANYKEGNNAGPHSIVNNFAFNATAVQNYDIAAGVSQTTINESNITVNSGGTPGIFTPRAGKWRNISMIP